MRWKLIIQWVVLGLLSILLIGCNTTLMRDPETNNVVEIPNEDVEYYVKKGWEPAGSGLPGPPVSGFTIEGSKQVAATTGTKPAISADAGTTCQDAPEKRPTPLPPINFTAKMGSTTALVNGTIADTRKIEFTATTKPTSPTVKLTLADDTTTVLNVAFEAGCAGAFSPTTAPCPPNAPQQACTGTAGTLCMGVVAAAGGGGGGSSTCVSPLPAALGGYHVIKVGSGCSIAYEVAIAPALTFLNPFLTGPALVSFFAVNGCVATPATMPVPGAGTVTVTGAACPAPGAYGVTLVPSAPSFFVTVTTPP